MQQANIRDQQQHQQLMDPYSLNKQPSRHLTVLRRSDVILHRISVTVGKVSSAELIRESGLVEVGPLRRARGHLDAGHLVVLVRVVGNKLSA